MMRADRSLGPDLDPPRPLSRKELGIDPEFLSSPQTAQRKRARSAGPAFGQQPAAPANWEIAPTPVPSVSVEEVAAHSETQEQLFEILQSPVGLRLDLKSANLSLIKTIGSQGYVRVVKHVPTGLVLIKKIYDHADREDLVRELRVMGSCVSNRIVALLGSTELASRTGKVEVYMEYMDFGSLDKVLVIAGTIPTSMLRHIAKSVVEALLYLANKLQMVHRDVRPARMFINSRGEVKLGGFRLSTRFDHQSASATESDLKLVRYYSPERAVSSSASIKDDVWSLGISLFEMAVGKHPYSAYRNHGDLLNAIAIEPAPMLQSRDDFTPQFHMLIAKCLTRVEERASLRQLQEDDGFIASVGTDNFDPQEWLTWLQKRKTLTVNRAASLTEGRTKDAPRRPRSLRPTSVRYGKSDAYLSQLSSRIEALSLINDRPASTSTARRLCQGCSEAVSSTMAGENWHAGCTLGAPAGHVSDCPLCQLIRSCSTSWGDSSPSPVIQGFWENNAEAAKVKTTSGTPILVVDKLDGEMDRIFRVEHAEGLDRDTSAAPAFQVAAAWLRKCMLEHRHCEGGSNPSGTPLPQRVIDVGPPNGSQPLRLYPGEGLSDVYFTLSYRWDTEGVDRASFVTTKSNIRSYYFEIPEARLPQVMQDAIQITREFGVRYLWIDALCIIQDSRSDWACQAKEMAAIYKNSTLTIAAAADPRDGEGLGCFRPRPQRRVRPVYCGIKWPDGSPVYLFADRRAAGGGIRPRSVLDRRAWILQEQLLSRRILTYSDRGLLFWDCVATSASESFPCGIPTFHDADLRHSELRLFKRFILQERSHEGIDPNPASLAAAKRQLYRHWRRVVEDYSMRCLTYGGDKVMALSGVAREVADFVEDRLIFGLWEGQLWRELLWWVREPSAATPIDAFSTVTWTWASLQGAVSFDLARGRARGDVLDPCLVVRELVRRGNGTDQHHEDNANGGNDENELPIDGRNYGVLTVEGVMVPLLPPGNQPKEPAVSVSHWRPDVSEILEAEVTCMVVAASERVVYGIGLIPYPDLANTYGRVGFVQWKGDVRGLGWNRVSKKWRRQAKLEIIHIM